MVAGADGAQVEDDIIILALILIMRDRRCSVPVIIITSRGKWLWCPREAHKAAIILAVVMPEVTAADLAVEEISAEVAEEDMPTAVLAVAAVDEAAAEAAVANSTQSKSPKRLLGHAES